MAKLEPITRKEQYISRIVGNTDYSPKMEQTRLENFFTEVLKEATLKPDPESRYEKYLAKIAGREIGIPEPVTRLERFLAKAAGMNISVPTPITREEMYWSTYSPFYLSNSSGTSPLTYGKCKIGTLSNYRIYGNTVSGESVGDRTANLFDEAIYNKNVQDNMIIYVPIYVGNIDYVTCSTTCPKTIYSGNDSDNSRYIFIFSGNVNTGAKNEINGVSNSAPRTIQPLNGYVTIAYRKIEKHNVRPWEYQTMLNVGSTALPYEPYGYKVPVTVSNGTDTLTATIYLPEQIKMVGDEAEYIDYASQKMYRIGADDLDVTLPALPTVTGTNVLSVGTEVQPSHIFAEFDKEREYG